jgi:hypothetical protein
MTSQIISKCNNSKQIDNINSWAATYDQIKEENFVPFQDVSD